MADYKDVEGYLDQLKHWQEEMTILSGIVQQSGLTETIKWGIPCYSFGKENVFGIAAFKHWVCVWFYQGSILKDKHGYLINAQEGVTKTLRQWRFTSKDAILNAPILEYIQESVDNFKNGIKHQPLNTKKALTIPSELQAQLDQDEILNSSWGRLSQACKREYALYISEAKREVTRNSRMAKIYPMIIGGKGINDAYKK